MLTFVQILLAPVVGLLAVAVALLLEPVRWIVVNARPPRLRWSDRRA